MLIGFAMQKPRTDVIRRWPLTAQEMGGLNLEKSPLNLLAFFFLSAKHADDDSRSRLRSADLTARTLESWKQRNP